MPAITILTLERSEDVAREFRTFVSRVESALPHVRIYYLSMKPSLLQWVNWPKYQQANAEISAICERDPRLAYIDVRRRCLHTGSRRHAFSSGLMECTCRQKATHSGPASSERAFRRNSERLLAKPKTPPRRARN